MSIELPGMNKNVSTRIRTLQRFWASSTQDKTAADIYEASSLIDSINVAFESNRICPALHARASSTSDICGRTTRNHGGEPVASRFAYPAHRLLKGFAHPSSFTVVTQFTVFS
jgi:hypothetical protein